MIYLYLVFLTTLAVCVLQVFLTQRWVDDRCRFRVMPRQEREVTLQVIPDA